MEWREVADIVPAVLFIVYYDWMHTMIDKVFHAIT
jgi:hypothetical protein